MDQSLALPVGDSTGSGRLPTPSKGLWTLLTEGDDSGKAVFALRKNLALFDEAKAVLPALERAKEPISRMRFAAMMVEQRAVFGLPDMEPGEWAAALEGYFAALAEFSEEMIRDAFTRWNRGEDMKDPAMGQFFPKPAQLVFLAKKSKAAVWSAAYRIRKAMDHVEEHPTRQLTEEERAENARRIREMMSQPARKIPPLPPGYTVQEWARKCREEGLFVDAAPTSSRSRQEVAASLLAMERGAAEDVGDVV